MANRFWLVVSAITLFHVSALAAEPDAKARARSLYQSGTTHYNLGEIRDALVDFKEAYRLVPQEPVFLFNIAQCYRRLGDPGQAADFYRSYRREVPNAPNRAEIDRLISEMDRAVMEKRAQEPPTGVNAPTTPLHPDANLAPTSTAAPLNLVTQVPPPRRAVYKRWWLWTAVGAGAVALGLGLGLGLGLSPHDASVRSDLGTAHPF